MEFSSDTVNPWNEKRLPAAKPDAAVRRLQAPPTTVGDEARLRCRMRNASSKSSSRARRKPNFVRLPQHSRPRNFWISASPPVSKLAGRCQNTFVSEKTAAKTFRSHESVVSPSNLPTLESLKASPRVSPIIALLCRSSFIALPSATPNPAARD